MALANLAVHPAVVDAASDVGCLIPRADNSDPEAWLYETGWAVPSLYNIDNPSNGINGLAGDGNSYDAPTIGGLRGFITAYANDWDSTSYSNGAPIGFDWQWVMLSNDIGGQDDYAQWAQVGPMTGDLPWSTQETGNNPPTDYAYGADGSGYTNDSAIMVQYTVGNSEDETPVTYDPSIQMAPGTSVEYKVLYNQEDYETTFWYDDGSGWQQILPFGNDDLSLLWTPTEGTMNGETLTAADQMYGDIVDPETFSGVNVYQDYSGDDYGTWYSMDNDDQATVYDADSYDWPTYTSDYQANAYAGYELNSATSLSIYDTGCPTSANYGQSELVAGGTYPVLGASGSDSWNELESTGNTTHNSPYYFYAQLGTGNFYEMDSSGRVLWTPGIDTSASTYSIMQGDCNYVIYDAWGQSPLFNTGTNGDGGGCYLDMESSGNLDLFESNGTLVWSDYAGWDSSYVHDTNSALLYGQTLSEGNVLWDPSSSYYLDMQTDGNLVLYNSSGTAEWDTNTRNWTTCASGDTCYNYLAMQTDGNLVEYSYNEQTESASALWNTGTGGTGSYNHMLVNPQGTISVQEVTQSGNQHVWVS